MPKFLVNIDLNQNEIQNVSLQKLATAPSNPTKGQVYYNTVDNRSFYWNGNSWVGMDSFGATMSAENIVTAINGSTFLIDDDNLSENVNDAIAKKHDTHSIADVTGLQTALNGKVDNSRVLTDVPAGAKFTDTVTTINGKTGVIVKADIVALGIPAQDTVYTLPVANGTTLGGVKSGTDITVDVNGNVSVNDDSHNHVISNVDGLQTALDGKSGTSHNHTLDDLSNVTVTSNSNGEILKYNGTAWVNNTLAEAGIATSDHNHSGTYAPNTHSHAILDVTGLQTELDSKETPAGATSKASTAENNAKAYTDTKIADLVDSSPSTLDTLNELAQALGDDPNFATTITNELAKKTDKYSQSIGDGSATSIVVTHNLNTRDVVVTLRETASPYSQVITDVEFTSVNTITLKFAVAPTSDQYTVTIIG